MNARTSIANENITNHPARGRKHGFRVVSELIKRSKLFKVTQYGAVMIKTGETTACGVVKWKFATTTEVAEHFGLMNIQVWNEMELKLDRRIYIHRDKPKLDRMKGDARTYKCVQCDSILRSSKMAKLGNKVVTDDTYGTVGTCLTCFEENLEAA